MMPVGYAQDGGWYKGLCGLHNYECCLCEMVGGIRGCGVCIIMRYGGCCLWGMHEMVGGYVEFA